MGREVRKVPKDWQHPSDRNGKCKPLHDGYNADIEKFKSLIEKEGVEYAIDYFGGGPQRENYMPDWPESERTHLMMYENTSEGTPISPAFETAQELARWLADNEASSFGNMTATYEQWLSMIDDGYAPSMVIAGNKMMSGVEASE